MSCPSPSQTLPRSARVRSRRDFARVFGSRLRASDRWITLYAAANEQGCARLGISVGRRFGGAVRRNRIKRLIREAFRHIRHELRPPADWIVIPRRESEPTAAELQRSIRTLAEKLGERLESRDG
jgi:ribonuclease P protein component